MKKTLTRLCCLLLCLLFCLVSIPACKRADPLAQNGIRSVEIIKKERVELLVTLNSSMVKEHKGQKICLYELLPGEDLSALEGKTPVEEKKVKGSVKFRIPLEENGIDRLYSSFVVAFSDGTLISEQLCGVKNPEFLASEQQRFPWGGIPKGLLTGDPEAAWGMGATHTLISLRLSELLNGSDALRFNDKQVLFSQAYLSGLDAKVSAASRTGMQVSLDLILDTLPSLNTVAAMLELLNSRYASGSEHGFISAWMLSPAEGVDASFAAEVARIARLGLRSRYSNGRVYLHLKGKNYAQTTEYFSLFSQKLAEKGAFEWGATVSPLCDVAPWESGAEEAMSVDKIPTLFSFLSGDRLSCKPSYLAVSGLRFSAENADLQAAKIAYSYQLALSCGASMVFYDEQDRVSFGLFDENGTPRASAEVFETMDLGLSEEKIAMIESLSLGKYSDFSTDISRRELIGSASVGSDGQENTLLYDFSEGDTHGFWAVNGSAQPSSKESASMGHPVLYTWLLASNREGGEGVRKILPDGMALENAFSISLRLLLQNLETPSSTVTLRLDGISKNGYQRVSFEASTEMVNDSRWQTAIFYIGSFVSEADLSQPCVMTVTADTSAPEGTEYLLWLDSVDVRKPPKKMSVIVMLLIVLGAVLVGFFLIFLIYRLSSKKRAVRRASYRR